MDFEEPVQMPIRADDNNAQTWDWQRRAQNAENVLNAEKNKRRGLQMQLDSVVETNFRARQQIQNLSNNSITLSQEVIKLNCVIETLQGVLRMICDHSTCGNDCNGELQRA
jgi:hypothetical protein